MINKPQNFRLLNYAASLFLFCLVILTAQSQAQVTVDSRSAGGAFSSTGLTTFSWTHAVGSGFNRALYFTISVTNQAAATPVCSPSPCPATLPTTALPNSTLQQPNSVISSIRVNGVFASCRLNVSVDPTQEVYLCRVFSPPFGENTITASFVPGVVTHAVGTSVSFFGVIQPEEHLNTIHSGGFGILTNTPSISLSGSNTTANDMLLGVLTSTPNAGLFVEGPGQTACTDPTNETTCTRGRRFFFNAYDVGAISTKQGNPAGTTMSWTMATAQFHFIIAVLIRAAPPQTGEISISGRVLTARGRAVARARVTLISDNGERRTTVTSSFGYYRFDNVQSGLPGTLTVSSKQFQFTPRVVTVNNSVTDLNLISLP